MSWLFSMIEFMTKTFDVLCDLIPRSLLHVSGAVFNTGPVAFNQSSDLYVLGLNPGGSPEENARETVESHTREVRLKPFGWSGFRDESWKGKPPGTMALQRRMLHAFNRIGRDPGRVPVSNVIFKRSRNARGIGNEMIALAELCWPFHEAAINMLGASVILCLGKDAANFVRNKLDATENVQQFKEENNRGLISVTYSNNRGVSVISATHPSQHDWCNSATDPTCLVLEALGLPRSIKITTPSIDKKAKKVRLRSLPIERRSLPLKRSLELLDELEKLGFNDEAYWRIHHFRVKDGKQKKDTIKAHRKHLHDRAAGNDQLTVTRTNMQVQQRLAWILETYVAEGQPAGNQTRFVELAEKAWNDNQY